jgi:hypothetical protein
MSHAVSAADQAGGVATLTRPKELRLEMSWNAGMSHGRAIERHGHLPDSSKESIDHVAGLALPQHPRLALLRLITLPQLKLSHRYRPVLAITLGRRLVGEAIARK